MALILNGTDGLSDVDGSASTPAIRGTDTNTGIFFPAADTIAFAEGGVEAMRIDSSGNLILGTTAVAAAEGYRFYKNYGRYDNGTFTGFIGGGTSLGSAATTDFTFRSENALAFMSGGANERMRIMSDGCLNIGKTDNATGKLDIGGQANGVATNVARFGNIAGLNNGPIILVDASNNWLINQASGSIRVGSTIAVGGATALYGVGGITFPATQAASADANTLDDYEEGTWTVSPVRWTWTGSKTGSYIKVGRLVHINYVVDATGISYTGAGSGWAIGGFPFPIDSVAIASLSECTAFNANLYLDNIGNELFGRNSSFTAGGIGTGSNFNSSGRIKFTVTYYTST